MNVVPTLPVEKRDSTGRIRHLNAYALDFFKHGSTRAIEEENGFVRKITVSRIFSITAVLRLHFSEIYKNYTCFSKLCQCLKRNNYLPQFLFHFVVELA